MATNWRIYFIRPHAMLAVTHKKEMASNMTVYNKDSKGQS